MGRTVTSLCVVACHLLITQAALAQVKRSADTREAHETLTFQAPGPGKLFRLESDAAFRERMRQEARNRRTAIEFPKDPVLSAEVYRGRAWPRITEVVEPNYVCYRRTHFEQINFERYGWELGLFQPALSVGKFWWDAFLLPYSLGSEPFRHYECNAGYCLPGDPAPLYLYPPHLNVTGAASQAAAMVGGFYFFP